jgi:glycosyltransferase involved in cell wall biosynthesis
MSEDMRDSAGSPGTKPRPTITVISTAFNHARYVEEALESLRRQTLTDFELIITDDASTDGCADVIQAWLDRTGFPAKFIRNKVNRGICACRNTALAQASGTFLCALPGDDAYEPDYLERQLRCFLAQPDDVCAIYGDARMIDAGSKPHRQSYLEARLGGEKPPQGNIFVDLLLQNFVPAPCVMLRRSAIADVGGYDEGLFYEDLDMWLRLSARYRFVYSPGQAVRIRMHSESMSSRPQNWSPMCRSCTIVLAKWLNAGLDDATRERLLDALFWNAALQLRHNDPAGARITFDHVIRSDARATRRLLAHAGRWPGASLMVRLLLPLYRLVRAFDARSPRAA